ncbi:MAG: efflux RND transporter periplasmic adaptor subunit [Candidatus Rokubacteria bacterium]|nr:efflux RND transporter periplasmic adaptor subunit [Candidatus Rokubacteria bacterium]
MPRSLIPLALGALLLGAVGCNVETSASTTSTKQPAKAAAVPPRPVKVTPAVQESIPRTVVATGTLAAEDQVVLGVKVAGRLGELTVDLGSRVKKGQTVARIDPGDYRLRVEQAQAALQQARARLGLSPDGTNDRVDPEQTALVRQARAVLDEARLTRERSERLAQQELIARSQLDAAVASLQVAEGRYQDAVEEVRNRQGVLAQRRSEVELARQQLSDTALVSPIDGAVSQRQASVGEFLAPGAPVATLVRLHPLRLRVAVPEREAANIRVGQPVKVTVEGDATEHGGRVARLSPAIQEQNRTLTIEAEIPNDKGLLRPGSFARASIVTQAAQAVVMVPASAIVTFAGIEKIITVKDNKSVERRVQTGRREGGRVEIVSGLAAGEPVVAEPGNLTGGQSVTVAP